MGSWSLRRRAHHAWLCAALLGTLACEPASKPSLTRPVSVSPTPFPQKDRLLAGLELLRVRYIDVPAAAEADVALLPVLLLPGLTSRVEEFDALVPILARDRRVLAFDFPGSGYSEKPDREYSLAYYEDAAVAFLDELALDRVHLAGGSLGGNLALRLAHRFPERVDRVAAWAPGSAWSAMPVWAALIRVFAGGFAGSWLFDPIARIQSRYWYRPDWPGREAALRDTFAYYEEVRGPGFVRMYFDLAADQLGRSLFELAPQVGRPVWLGWGDQDDGLDMGAGVARLHEQLPHSELRVFPGARHSLAAEVPEPLAEAVADFLSRPEADLPWAAGR